MSIRPIPLLAVAAVLLAWLATPAGALGGGYVPAEVIVRYEDGTSVAAQDALEREIGVAAADPVAGGSEQLAIGDGDSVRATINELEADPSVKYAVPNWRAHAAAQRTNDPGSRLQWNLFSVWGVNAPEAWALAAGLGAPGGRGAVVAVLDSGVAYETRGRFRRAPDLRRSTFVKPYDFIGKDRHPNDVFGHGTHVSGTIAQTTNNGMGAAGIAYNAKIMPLKVLDDEGFGNSAAIARAIRYAAREGADVINLSLEFPPDIRSSEIPDVLRAIRQARRAGVVVVAAAGNGEDIRVAYPARAQSVIAVGATTVNGCQADYSNSGSELDLVAPGGGPDAPNDDSAWDLAHCRQSSAAPSIFQQTFVRGVRRFGLPGFEGTSMASPHVAAIAALVIATGRLGEHPGPKAVEAHLEATARATDRPDRYGAGLVDAAAALR